MPAPELPVKVPSELQKKQEALRREAEKGGGESAFIIVLSLRCF